MNGFWSLHNRVLRALAALLLLAGSASAKAQFAITEFLSLNTSGLRDEDGDLSDWMEVQNTTSGPANLEGWFLTDASAFPQRWRFPATNLAANARLIVFASGKNRVSPGSNLHTNFRLSASGGYLALVRPDGMSVASRFLYPRQFPDVSYGTGVAPSGVAEELIRPGSKTRYRIPTSVLTNWTAVDYVEDAAWNTGPLPAGYDSAPGPVTVAYITPQNTAGNQAYPGCLGMDFNLLSPLLVTELGCFDDLSDGFASGTTITVQIWSRDDKRTPASPGDDVGGSVLASRTFDSTSPGILSDGSRFKTLAGPLALTNGAYTIVAYGYGNSERNGNAAIDGFSPPTLDTGGGVIQFAGSSRWGDKTNAFPGIIDASVAQYGAGTFKYQVVSGAQFPTSLQAMRNTNSTVYFRAHFTPPSAADYGALLLSVTYDDGFVAWLNGTEVARRNAPFSPGWHSAATNVASTTENFALSPSAYLLRPGADNVLAVQGLNIASSDVDFRMDFALSAEARTAASAPLFFTLPTPGEENSSGIVWPGVVINEIHCDPPNSKAVPAEFIELYNPLLAAVDISGWAFTKGVQFVFPPGTVLSPKGCLVVAESPAVIQSQFGVAALGPWAGSLRNEGDTVELSDASGATVDTVTYGLGFPWPTVGDDPGYSMQLLNEGLDHNLGGSWRSGLPSPGARNPLAAANVPPQVRQVNHAPKAPISGNLVTITAKITDPDGVRDVTLEYQAVDPGNYIPLASAAYTNTWNSIPMRDDGLAGDTVAGDFLFTAQIPAQVQTHRRLVRYRINASDARGNSVRVPYSDDPSPNFAYFVYDGVPAWSGAVNPATDARVVFGTNIMRQVRPVHLIGNAGDIANSQYNTAYGNGLYHFKGTVVADGEVYDHVGYRIAGQNSTYATGKNKWKFKFNRGHWFEFRDDRGKLLSTRRETIKFSGLTEPWAAWNRGLAGLDEALAFRLYNLAGVAAPATAYVHFRVIDDTVEAKPADQYAGDLWGLYLRFEEYDGQFKDEHGLPDGNLFLLQGGNDRIGSRGKGQPGDFSDLNSFRSGSTGYNAGSQPLGWWRANVDLNAYYTWRAITEAINNTDIREGENVAYFRNPTNGLWSIHPWDSDLLYEQFDRWGPEGTQSQSPYEQIRSCLKHPSLLVEFQSRGRELQDLLLNHEQITALANEFLSYITEAGPGRPGFVEVDRRMWDWNPLTRTPPRSATRWGNYYRNPFPIPDMSYGPYPQPYFRTLVSADFAGQVAWLTNFIVSDPHGGARLARMASDNTIPLTPGVTYAGPAGYPWDALTFSTAAFESPAGRTFAALRWRAAEVSYPGISNYVLGDECHYEIESVWDSGEITAFEPRVTLPPLLVKPGCSYRVRVKHKDSGGRWSHWSAPLQFLAGTNSLAALAPAIVAHPMSLTATNGTAAVFAASASGQSPIAWQWRKNGVALTGATNDTLTLTNLSRQDGGAYFAVASNLFGTAASDTALLRVLVAQRLGAAEMQPGGLFQLYSCDGDPRSTGSGELTGFSAEVSSNLLTWEPLSSALTITNGQLLLRDASATNHFQRFYRIREK